MFEFGTNSEAASRDTANEPWEDAFPFYTTSVEKTRRNLKDNWPLSR
jgi:hypothetical protein